MEALLFLPLVILTTLVRVIVLLKSSITQALMDTVEVTLNTTDYRGALDGVLVEADVIKLVVASRAEFLAAMREVDSQTDEKLDRIIKAQLGIGDRQ